MKIKLTFIKNFVDRIIAYLSKSDVDERKHRVLFLKVIGVFFVLIVVWFILSADKFNQNAFDQEHGSIYLADKSYIVYKYDEPYYNRYQKAFYKITVEFTCLSYDEAVEIYRSFQRAKYGKNNAK